MKTGLHQLVRYSCPIAESVRCRATCAATAALSANTIIIWGILRPRIANRHNRMKKGSMIRRILAFVMSRIVYVAPYLGWFAAEKIDCLIRSIHKQAV